ncbi:MAG TPA: hypothetical protein VFY14_10340 [Streptomyces sp.]|nr:hypothetical protein [Streptomyces sp.]
MGRKPVPWDEEWHRIARNAAGSTGMNLASADTGGGGGGSGGLKSSKAAWNKAGNDVGDLRGDIKKALGKLKTGQEGLGAGSDTAVGLQSGAAQLEVYRSWKRYLEDVSRRCGALRTQLEKAGGDHHGNDAAIKEAFDGLGKQYKDTPALGGQEQGR